MSSSGPHKSSKAQLHPLQELLDSVLARLDVLEGKTPAPRTTPSSGTGGGAPPSIPILTDSATTTNNSSSVRAYDELLEHFVKPLAQSCNALGNMKTMGSLVLDAWTSVRTIVVLASRAKKPTDVADSLQPHLGPTHDAIKSIRTLRLDRTYDNHCKALLESLGCLSWILIAPPPQTPKAFVQDSLASTDYWSNKIRKQYKQQQHNNNKEGDLHIAFCNALTACLKQLMVYIAEHHKTGLTWNPRGVSLAEAAITWYDQSSSGSTTFAATAATKTTTTTTTPSHLSSSSPLSPRRKYLNVVSGGTGGTTNLMAELEQKRTADGSSAATGLKHVNRDQQTWRKEYKDAKAAVVPTVAPVIKKPVVPSQKKRTGLPICEYQERGHKWVVEHQTKQSCGGKVLTVEVTDPKQQVYMFNCDNVTVKVEGSSHKFKSVIMDKCTKCNVVFHTVISACEMVNCKRVQVQTLGVCPSFSIDKTEGCLVYLSAESLGITTFTTCQSTEMNVSFPDGDEQKELPIPEQFVHKLDGGIVKSEVSDLYH